MDVPQRVQEYHREIRCREHNELIKRGVKRGQKTESETDEELTRTALALAKLPDQTSFRNRAGEVIATKTNHRHDTDDADVFPRFAT